MIRPSFQRGAPPGFPRTAVGGGASDTGRTVLVCDDERHIVRLIQVNFERMGYVVLTAFDGKEGLEMVRTHKPDFLILDAMMPFLNGFEVIRVLRADPEFENLPIILLTAKCQDRDIFEGYHAGADMYLTKPFNPMELALTFGGKDRF
jgi:two-component system alkaline phosphatase synthesis response regulator PhoP/two-component system response regulator VicR